MKRDWLSIIGNFAIVLSLLFVGYQVQQDRQIAAAQLHLQTWLSISSWQTSMMGENPSIALSRVLEDPESLTMDDVHTANWYVATYLNFLNHFARLKDLGLDPGQFTMEQAARSSGKELGENPLTRAVLKEIDIDPRWREILLEEANIADPSEHKSQTLRILREAKRSKTSE